MCRIYHPPVEAALLVQSEQRRVFSDSALTRVQSRTLTAAPTIRLQADDGLPEIIALGANPNTGASKRRCIAKSGVKTPE
jgi:hypothetical protein